MARVPQPPYSEPVRRRRRDNQQVIQPEGKFIRQTRVRVVTDRTPRSVTRIRPEDMEPILPEMPYIPPA